MTTLSASQPSATPSEQTASAPQIERVKHELKRRELTVTGTTYVTPQMLRLTLHGEALSDFHSAAPDDHVKLIIPTASGEAELREYTPRHFDPSRLELTLDFAIHDAGPATRWALEAAPGTVLTVGGPRGSMVISGVTKWVLVGDETALPAIGRRIEEAAAGDVVTSVVAVAGADEEQVFNTTASWTPHWVYRPLSQATDASGLIERLEQIALTDDTFVWVAAEGSVARAIRSYLIDRRNHPRSWIKASGYWALGRSDAHETISD